MPDIPEEMKKNGRPRIPEFDPDEYLYRRVMPQQWDEAEIDIDAIELPDMSVNRSSLGPPQWVRLEEDRCQHWAVVGFKVKDIPTDILHLGIDLYTFYAMHIPLELNYPHSEVRCNRNGVHINAKRNLDKALHQRWREKLLWKMKTFLRPYEVREE
jgi:hypothetical protein